MYVGELAALAVSICWTISAVFFEKAGRKIGSLSVNFIRLVLAFVFLSMTTYFTSGQLWPAKATAYQWFWLGLSGVVGLYFGDLMLFKSYLVIGSRTAALVMSSVPMLVTFIGWIVLHERLDTQDLVAVGVTILGIVIAIADRRLKLKIPLKGFLLAFGGAIGQAAGLILSKKGMGDYDPIAATQIRVIFGLVCFVVMITVMRRWGRFQDVLKDKSGMTAVGIGSFFGPFVGIALSLFAIQQTKTGVASTLMALVPVFIIVPTAFMFKEKITPHHVIGAVVSIVGVSLFFL